MLINTAVDALGHMLESYFHSNATDYSRMLCLRAMKVWGTAANVLFGKAANEENYDSFMFASSLAGMAIAQTGTSLPHGLSYYLTYHKGIPHGKAVGVFLAEYLSFLPQEYEEELMVVLQALGFESLGQFRELMKELLGTMEVTDEDITNMVGEMTQNERKLVAAPFKVTKEQLIQMCEAVRG